MPEGIDSMLSDHAGASSPPMARPAENRKPMIISGLAANPVTKVSAAPAIVHQMITGRRP